MNNQTRMDRAASIDDLRQIALGYLPDFVGQFVETGGGGGQGLRRNIEAYEKYQLLTRSLVDVSRLDTHRTILGITYAQPFGISAVGELSAFRRHSEEMLAEVAREEDIPFMLSGCSSSSIEKIAALAPKNVWFQLYAAKDSKVTDHMVQRARDAGVGVLVITVDFPVKNRNDVARRTGVSNVGMDKSRWPSILWDLCRHRGWAWENIRSGGLARMESWAPYVPEGSSAEEVVRYFDQFWPANLLWSDIERIRARWPGRLVLKGLTHPQDILKAADVGADAVIVSNHGGNKLDCMPASIDLLVMARAAVGQRIELFVDGGIRRGEDILKAMVLGADFCLFARPTLYGVSAGGLVGARRAIEILRDELIYAQAMSGCPDYETLQRERLVVTQPSALAYEWGR